MSGRAGISVIKYVFGELIGDVLYAPLWWYGRGFIYFLDRLRARLIGFEHRIGLGFWISNLGKPMYGQYDLVSKIISFFIRLALLFAKLILFLGYLVWLLFLALLWLILPLIVVWGVLFQLRGLLTQP